MFVKYLNKNTNSYTDEFFVKKADGNWGPWGAWSACSATYCGPGQHRKERLCNNPPPGIGGKPCEGSDYMVEPCKVWDCGTPSMTVVYSS